MYRDMVLSVKSLNIINKLLELGVSPIEIAEIKEVVDEHMDDEQRVYEALKNINPELAEVFRKEIELSVWRSDLKKEPFNRSRIVESLVREVGLSKSMAERVAKDIEKKIRELNLSSVTSTLIRELVLIKLLEQSMEQEYKKYSRIGIPTYDLYRLISQKNFRERILERIFAQFTFIHLLPYRLAEYVSTKTVRIGSISNPAVPYSKTYIKRVSTFDRWIEGYAEFLYERGFVGRPSVYIPSWFEESEFYVVHTISKPYKPVFWSDSEDFKVPKSDIPLYEFGGVPDRTVKDYIEIDTYRLEIELPTEDERRKALREIKELLLEYEEKRSQWVKNGTVVIRFAGSSNYSDIFDDVFFIL